MVRPNWKNRTLFRGDNLVFLRAMNSGSVHLIATDPPFNKGRDFHATPDSLAAGAKFQDRWSWERDIHQDWIDQITDDYPRLMEAIESARYAHSHGMGAYMCFMAVRLLEMHRILRDDGAIYLHCDPTASHYLKAVMDAIFGWRNFGNHIVWHYRGAGVPRDSFARRHDIVLRYAKKIGKHHFDPDPARQPYARATVERFGHYIGNVRGNSDYGRQSLNPLGKHPDDVIADIQPIAPSSKDRVGFPTQKPLRLYERLIATSSRKGDVVLDPFAGCATTLVAAELLGRRWAGMDIWDEAPDVVVERLNREGLFKPKKTRRAARGQQNHLFAKDFTFTSRIPKRTDDGQTSSPFLRVKRRFKEPAGPKMSRAEMYDRLLEQHGPKCQGCDRLFDDPRYLELDHNTPRSDGGLNHITNRILLCGPCNRLKGGQCTLSGLRRRNGKLGHMANRDGKSPAGP